MTNKEILAKISETINIEMTDVSKLIKIERLVKDNFIINKDEDIPELKDPKKVSI